MSRNIFIDYLKGVAIFLVAWGHAIQYLDYEYDCFKNPLYLFIYSFHMPLFMCVSGYLFAFSVKKKGFKKMLIVKIKQLIIPLLCWGFFVTWLLYYKELQRMDLLHGSIRYLYLIIRTLPDSLWFLWALFVLSMISSFIAQTKYSQIALHVLAFVILLCLPDMFGLSYVKFMYPFFLMGYFYNLYVVQLQVLKKYVLPLSFIIFPICYYYWSKIDLIYFNPMSFYHTIFLEHLYIVVLRYVIGFTRVIVAVTVIKRFLFFPKITFIMQMGVFSLGIYIITFLINTAFTIYFAVPATNQYLYTFVYAIIFALVSILFSIYITKVIGKSPQLSKLLFGGRY